MDLSLDGFYHATTVGLQIGVAGTVAAGIVTAVGALNVPCLCTVFVLTTLLGMAVTMYFDSLTLPANGKAVLVTGSDSGFGYELALILEKLGFVVFAGCLLLNKGGDGAKKLQSKQLKNLHVVQMDVTSEEEIAKAVDYIGKNLPSGGLWGVVNNAGWSTFGHVEWVPISTCKKIMDINVWGMLRVTQAVLPFIRKAKGRVVNVASGLGRVCAPDRSSYGITKYGVEALSDCLRFEMRRWDVQVSIIEPGNFVNATGIFTPESIHKNAEALWSQIPEPVQKDYTKQYFNSIINNMTFYCTKGTTEKTPVLDAMTRALTQSFPRARYQPMELYFKVRTWVNTHLPEWVYETLYL